MGTLTRLAKTVIRRSLGPVLPRRDGGPDYAPDGTLIFSEEDFRSREKYRPNYAELCQALCDTLDFRTVLDLGCGNGFVLSEMLARGKGVRGVELSPAVRALLPADLQPLVTIGSATSSGKLGEFDLVVCVEVAEHVPPEESDGLLDTISANARDWVYFTAASPFQPGHGHINCRQQFFWMDGFRRRGFDLEWDKTRELVGRIADMKPAVWLPMNSLVFRRREGGRP